jgi:DNA-binding NarL/FixJ family response regulator
MARAKPLQVVIIDDSVVIRQRLVGLLGEVHGVEVSGVATDGFEGLDTIQKLRPDVVILDIRMPGMGGIELLETLQADDNPSPTIIVLTNFPYPAYRKRCQELGAEYFFDKSTEFAAAVEVLQEMSTNGR